MGGTLFINGRFLQGSQFAEGSAIYVEEGVIQAIGDGGQLRLQLSGRSYRTVDWEGASVLPGLADSHMHLSMHGMKLSALDFSLVTSKEEMLGLVRRRASELPEGEWIVGYNWNENAFAAPLAPTRQELDAAAKRHPVFLTRVCYHAYLANSLAFRLAGITEHMPDPPSGAYGRDADGGLNGRVYEDAGAPFQAVIPEPDYEVKKACIRRAALDALRLGLTAVHTDDLRFIGSLDTLLRIHRELREEGILLRTNQLVDYRFLPEATALGLKSGSGDAWLRIGAAKIFADGVLGGRTALLSEPYADEPAARGIGIQTPEELAAIVQGARAAGFAAAVHAIGDEATARTLAALAAHPLAGQAGGVAWPDRLIHAVVLRPDLIAQMKALPLVADIQPHFVLSDFPWALERIGEERAVYGYAWKKLLQAGIPCAGGSDAPIEPLNPFLGLYAAVHRRRPGDTHSGYLPEEKLSLPEAVDLFTRGSALAAGESGTRGQLAAGYAADFTVVDRDPFAAAETLPQTGVRMTVVNGEIAYRA